MSRFPLFPLGRIVGTPAALAALDKAGVSPISLVFRHGDGDWGDLSPGDRAANDRALECDERIFSAYVLPDGVKVWVITEADRSSTCVLLPNDY